MATNLAELDVRVSVVETEIKNMQETLGKLEKHMENNNAISLEVKERLDKWNGSIPHMAETVKEMSKRQEVLLNRCYINSERYATDRTKMKIMWIVVGFLLTGIGTFALNSILK